MEEKLTHVSFSVTSRWDVGTESSETNRVIITDEHQSALMWRQQHVMLRGAARVCDWTVEVDRLLVPCFHVRTT